MTANHEFLTANAYVAFLAVCICLQVTVVVVLAWTAACCVGRHRIALRHSIWCTAVGISVICPVFALITPELPKQLWDSSFPSRDQQSAPQVKIPRVKIPRVKIPQVKIQRAEDPVGTFTANPAARAEIEGASIEELSARSIVATFANQHANSSRNRTPLVAGAAAAPRQDEISAMGWISDAFQRSVASHPKLLGFVGLVWLFGACCASIRLVVGIFQIRHLRRTASNVVAPEITALVTEVANELGQKRIPEILLMPDGATPFVIGWLHPAVLLNPDFRELAFDDRQAILRHELAHLRHKHHHYRILQQLLAIVYWFHPFVHKMNHEFCFIQEEICDNRALVSTDAGSYSRLLLAIAEKYVAGNPAPSMSFLPRHTLRRRVSGLLDEKRDTKTRSIGAPVVGLAFACVACVFAIGTGATSLSQAQTPTFADLERTTPPKSVETRKSEPSQPLADNLPHPIRSYVAFRDMQRMLTTPRFQEDMKCSPIEWATRQVERHLTMDRREFKERMGVDIASVLTMTKKQVVFAKSPRADTFDISVALEAETPAMVDVFMTARKPIGRSLQAGSERGVVWCSELSDFVWNGKNAMRHQKLHSRIKESSLAHGDGACLTWFRDLSGPQVKKSDRFTSWMWHSHYRDLLSMHGIGGAVTVVDKGPVLLRHHSVCRGPAKRFLNGEAAALDFQNRAHHSCPDWIPNGATRFGSIGLDLTKAMGTLQNWVDIISGEPGFSRDVIASLRDDPQGPKIDLHRLVALLNNHVITVTLTKDDGGPAFLWAIETKDPAGAAELVAKLFENDPAASRTRIDGIVVWKSVFAASVFDSRLVICSDPKALENVIRNKNAAETSLNRNAVYQELEAKLNEIASQEQCIRLYHAGGEELTPPYGFDSLQDFWLKTIRVPNEPSTPRNLTAPSGMNVVADHDGWQIQGIVLRPMR